MKEVVILGAGGHAHVIADIVSANGDKVLAYLDDNKKLQDRSGDISDYINYKDALFVIGIGSATVRERLATDLHVNWYTAIHPSAVISNSSLIGDGTVVMPNAVINARAKIGVHCIVNTGTVIEHDNEIADFAHVSVGAKLGGMVVVGKKTWIGIGATIKNNVSICANCMIGAGAVVVHDILESGTYAGIPAKRLN